MKEILSKKELNYLANVDVSAVDMMERGKYYIRYYNDNSFSIFLCSKPFRSKRAYGHHVNSKFPNMIGSVTVEDLENWELINREDIKLKSNTLDKLESLIKR